MSEAFNFVMFKHVTYWEKHNSGSTDKEWKKQSLCNNRTQKGYKITQIKS